MTGQLTSPGMARWTPAAWREFGAFLRRPELPEQMTGIRPAAIAGTLKLFALDVVLMAVLLGLVGLAIGLGLHIPPNAIDKLKITPLLLVVIIVVAPVSEEIVFRSWLSGRAGHILATVALVVGVALPIISGPQAHPILMFGSFSIAAVLAVALAFWLRKRRAMPHFSRHFAWFYFASALLFGLAHLTNYTQGAALILLPLVVPQMIAGLIFGYARVTYGLWSDILLHMLHNGVLISLVVMQKGL